MWRTDIDRRTPHFHTAVALHPPTTMAAGRRPPTSPPRKSLKPAHPFFSLTSKLRYRTDATTDNHPPHVEPKPRLYHHHHRTPHAYQKDNAATRCARQRSRGACAATKCATHGATVQRRASDDGDDDDEATTTQTMTTKTTTMDVATVRAAVVSTTTAMTMEQWRVA
ncbi:hypothetical protein EDB85DRAFT_2040916 [Lactarius pseudohatsudake]|nr:hypothetical protein EDB85DRAFT_2040916 [Lactarius pseudohatsudake]